MHGLCIVVCHMRKGAGQTLETFAFALSRRSDGTTEIQSRLAQRRGLNTNYFQVKSLARRSHNRIAVLENAAGILYERKEEIHGEVHGFYTSLYTTQQEIDIEVVLHHISPRVSELINERLVRPFTKEEVRFACFSMRPSTAPGDDGLMRVSFSATGRSLRMMSPRRCQDSCMVVICQMWLIKH